MSEHGGLSCTQAVAGIVADGRQVVNRACEESRSYKRWVSAKHIAVCSMSVSYVCSSSCLLCSFYGDAIPGHVLADRVASFVHVFNLYWYAR